MTTDGDQTTGTGTMRASEFKAKCLKLMHEVAESSQEIIITKNGDPSPGWRPIGSGPKACLASTRAASKSTATSCHPCSPTGSLTTRQQGRTCSDPSGYSRADLADL